MGLFGFDRMDDSYLTNDPAFNEARNKAIFLIDISSSMNAVDPKSGKRRIDIANEGLGYCLDYIREHPQVNNLTDILIVQFNQEPSIVEGWEWVRAGDVEENPRLIASGYTRLERATRFTLDEAHKHTRPLERLGQIPHTPLMFTIGDFQDEKISEEIEQEIIERNTPDSAGRRKLSSFGFATPGYHQDTFRRMIPNAACRFTVSDLMNLEDGMMQFFEMAAKFLKKVSESAPGEKPDFSGDHPLRRPDNVLELPDFGALIM